MALKTTRTLAWILAAMPACGAGVVDSVDPEAVEEEDEQEDEQPSDIAASCEPASGTQLRLELVRASDGTEAVLGVHDDDLGVACDYRRHMDGSFRCLPSLTAPGVVTGEILYRDSGCTAPIAVHYGDPGASLLISTVQWDSCESADRVHRLAAEIEGLAYQYRRTDDGQCVAEDVAPAATLSELGDEIPGGHMISGLDGWTDSGRISQWYVVGSDGSRLCGTRTRDNELGQECRLSYVSGDVRCLPTANVEKTSSYSDADCSDRVALVMGDETCGPVGPMATELVDGCEAFRVWRVAGEVGQAFWSGDGGYHCEPIEEATTAHALGDPVAMNELAGFERRYATGEARLRRAGLVSGDLTYVGGRFHDQELDLECRFERATDGSYRCLPAPGSGAGVVMAYTDPVCTDGIEVADLATDQCHGWQSRYAVQFDGDVGRVHELEVQARPLYHLTDAGCVSAPSGSYAELGSEVSPEIFVGGTATLE